MTDIAKDLRERSLLTEQEGEPLALLDEAADEIERLRLTDAEREAIARAADWLFRWQQTHGYHSEQDGDLATLRGLLERT